MTERKYRDASGSRVPVGDEDQFRLDMVAINAMIEGNKIKYDAARFTRDDDWQAWLRIVRYLGADEWLPPELLR